MTAPDARTNFRLENDRPAALLDAQGIKRHLPAEPAQIRRKLSLQGSAPTKKMRSFGIYYVAGLKCIRLVAKAKQQGDRASRRHAQMNGVPAFAKNRVPSARIVTNAR